MPRMVRSLIGTACVSVVVWACGSAIDDESGSSEEALTADECEANAVAANDKCVKYAGALSEASQREAALAICAKTYSAAKADCALLPRADAGPSKDAAASEPKPNPEPEKDAGSTVQPMTPAECEANAVAANDKCVKYAGALSNATEREAALAACAKAYSTAKADCALLPKAEPKKEEPKKEEPKTDAGSTKQTLTAEECEANAVAANDKCVKYASALANASEREVALAACAKTYSAAKADCALLPKADQPESKEEQKKEEPKKEDPKKDPGTLAKPEGSKEPPRDAGAPVYPDAGAAKPSDAGARPDAAADPPPKSGGGSKSASDAGAPRPDSGTLRKPGRR